MKEKEAMARAIELGAAARRVAPPNPWVGCVVLDGDGKRLGEGASAAPGGPHAEVTALAEAGERAAGGTLVVTLEPCSHHGRTPPCVEAIVRAEIRRVVVAIDDPDQRVRGTGLAALRDAGIDVEVGLLENEAVEQLRAYLHHRHTGRPFVVLKLAATIDGRIAAPDGSSRWITGTEARADVHRLRAASDAVVVGAGTVRSDDPELTVREVDGRDPLRVVLGHAESSARVQPAVELKGEPDEILNELESRGVLQVLLEGGADVAARFHRAGLVDRYVLYFAPALMGGEDGVPIFRGEGVGSLNEAWRGRFVSVTRLGDDLKVELEPLPSRGSE